MYRNRDGLFEVEFAEPSDTERDTVTISSEGNILSWEVVKYITPDFSMQTNASAELIRTPILSTAEMVIPVADFSLLSEEEHLTVAKKSASRAMYTDALGNGIDLVYDVSGNKVKESIIIDSFEENASYIAEITAEGLTAVLNEDGSINFTDAEGETVFIVEAPYMFDSGMGFSNDIQVDLIEDKTGGYILAYTPDEEWLENEDRVYPVTLDPTVTVYNNRTTPVTYKDDTVVWNGSTSGSVITTGNLISGHYMGNYYYTLIDYTDLPKLPNNATVTEMHQVLFIAGGDATLPSLKSFTLKKEYESGSISFANILQSYNSNSGIQGTYGVNSAGDQYIRFNYTGEDIQNFATYDPTTGKLYSNGFLIGDDRHVTSNISEFQNQVSVFYSSDSISMTAANSTQYARPYVSIKYTRNEPPEGVYLLNNVGAGFDSYINKWFLDKVEGASNTLSEDYYGPYYIRSAYYDSAPVYLSHRGGQLSSLTVATTEYDEETHEIITLGEEHLPPAQSSAVSGDVNSDYYWYLRDIGNNRYSIHYTTGTVLAAKSDISSVTYVNIFSAFELQTINSSSAKQQWTLTISPTSTSFIWPLEYDEEVNTSGKVLRSTHQLTSLWGQRRIVENGKEKSYTLHKGIDIRTSVDTGYVKDLLSVADGVVIYARENKNGCAGNEIIIAHKSMITGSGAQYNYYISVYMHLSQIDVSVGQFVKQGQIIGKTGNSGKYGKPAHLHLEFGFTNTETVDEYGIGHTVFNPTNAYHETDTRSVDTINNPNPIYNISTLPEDKPDSYVHGKYLGVNENFIFNYPMFGNPEEWDNDDTNTYKLLRQP